MMPSLVTTGANHYICCMKKTLTLLLIASTAITAFAQKSRIELNLKQDSTYYLNMNSALTITQDIPGHQQVITTTITGSISHKVAAIKDTVYELTVRYENLGIKMELGGTTLMNADSRNKNSQDVVSQLMNNLLHKPVTVLITKSGKVLEVKDIDNLYANLFDGFPQVTDEQKAQFKAQMQQSFGEKAFKNNFQDAFAVLPSGEVGVNDSWVANTKLETVAVANIKTTYVLKSVTDRAYAIHGDAVVTGAGTADFVQSNGMPVRFNNVSGTTSAEITIDKATGWIIDSKTRKNIKGDMEIKDNPKVPGGMNFPMSIDGDVNVANK